MRWFSFLSPLATLILGWFSLLFLIFLPPILVLWPFLIIGMLICNYQGIRQVLGRGGRARPWHAWFNVVEWAVVVALLVWIWP